MRTLKPPPVNLKGFTLTELLVTMGIVAILIAVVMPTYLSSIRKSRRTEAKAAVMDVAGREERYYSTTNTYSATPSDIGYAAVGVAYPVTVASGYYTVTVTTAAGPPATYSITANPVTGQGQEKDLPCASFTVTQTGQQSALNSAGADNTTVCWR